MSRNKLLFIQILDKELVALFEGLQSIFNGRGSTSPVHITVKGPQKSNFKKTLCNNFSDLKLPLEISKSSYFSYSTKYFVYFKVQIPKMEKYRLWNKSTFQTEKNPHITVCETSNEEFSKDIVRFLNKEVGNLSCREYKFYEYTLRDPSQHNFVIEVEGKKLRNIDDASILNLIHIGKVKKGLFTRARKLKEKHVT